MSQRLLGRPQRNWEFCLDCETFFSLLSCSTYTRVSSALVWSTVLISCEGGGSGFTRLLDRVESKAKRLINCSFGALSLFYRHPSGKCSRELIICVPPSIRRPRSTRSAV